MDTATIREAFLTTPDRTQDISTPEWLASVCGDVHLTLRDIPANKLALLQKQAKKNGQMADLQLGAALICYCLLDKATGEPVFQVADRDAIMELGAGKLNDIAQQIGAFLGIIPTTEE